MTKHLTYSIHSFAPVAQPGWTVLTAYDDAGDIMHDDYPLAGWATLVACVNDGWGGEDVRLHDRIVTPAYYDPSDLFTTLDEIDATINMVATVIGPGQDVVDARERLEQELRTKMASA